MSAQILLEKQHLAGYEARHMMKSALAFALLCVTTFSTSLPPAYAAGNADLVKFFGAFEGHWAGNGRIHQIELDGSQSDTRYTMDVRVDGSGMTDEWNADSSIVTETGMTSQNRVTYSVRGDLLFVSANGVLDPVKLVEATPFSLTYQLRRADFYSGRVYDFTFQQSISPDLRELSGRTLIELNGVTISDEFYSARHW